MCFMRFPALAVLAGALSLSSANAQVFESGSDGSFGPILVEAGETVTIDLPPDGIINATTVTVGGLLKFNRNPLNTPVFLLATGDIIVSAGLIDVSGTNSTHSFPYRGMGGPGGFDGGMPALGGFNAGAGLGPGGALGHAGYSIAGPGVNAGGAYGSPLLMPLVGGSGGGGLSSFGGGGGGGAILLASSTRVELNSSSAISANGAWNGISPWGSGGAIRIVAPVVAGNGLLRARGGGNDPSGRIRIDTIDRTQMQWSVCPAPSQGRFMKVFQDVIPRLDILDVAGVAIPEGGPNPVTVQLPFDGDPMQTVTVRATDFTGIVPIEVVLSPDSGDRIVFPAVIDMGLGNPSDVVVDIVVPLNTSTRIHAWTQSVP